MNEFRIRALSCIAVAAMLVFQTAASGGLLTGGININTSTDTGSNISSTGFSFRNGYIQLFAEDAVNTTATLDTLTLNLTSQTVEDTSWGNDFSVVFFASGVSGAVATISSAATDIGSGRSATIDGVNLSSPTPITWDSNNKIEKATSGFTNLKWTSNTGAGDNGGSQQTFSRTWTFDGNDSAVEDYGTLAGIALKDLSAYYFNGYTGGSTAIAPPTPAPSSNWTGTFSATASGATTAVPEPGSLAMAVMGMATLFGGLRRRRR